MPSGIYQHKSLSEQHKQAISRGMIGREFSENHKINLSLALRGKKKDYMADEKHPMWRGDKVKYIGLHMWVARKLGKPDTCEHCHRSNLSGRLIHWANKSGNYLRDLSDWLRLCAKCHKQYDLKI
ncbi:MAG: hypothetical protein IH948_10660 [Bacteroidetes bacterium]|nr:hypothetical protein [Bacteroidota bacterium]